MRYVYDGTADALYITFRDEKPQRQVRLEDGTVIDLGSSDAVVGVEVLVPSSPWDPDSLTERWSLEPRELAFLRSLARSFAFSRRLLGCATRGGKQVPENSHLAA